MNTIRMLVVTCAAVLLTGLPATAQDPPEDPDCLRVIAASEGSIDLQTVTIPELQRELDAGAHPLAEPRELVAARDEVTERGPLHNTQLGLDRTRGLIGARAHLYGLRRERSTIDAPTDVQRERRERE